MFRKIIKRIEPLLGRKTPLTIVGAQGDEEKSEEIKTDNNAIKARQIKLLLAILIAVILVLGVIVAFVSKNAEKKAVELAKPDELKVELADKALNPDESWRQYHEGELKDKTDELRERLNKAEGVVEETKKKMIEEMQGEIAKIGEQLKAARQELSDAGHSLREVALREQERIDSAPMHEASVLEMQDFADDVELDTPKSAADYVPEGTYFTGYLLGGIVVSTALNTPDNNATPLTIRLKSRGNLASENETDISKCRIIGSAYGDLSSERAVIRLEKLICEKDGMYITSQIAGDVHGPDGFNGIKGTVVSTGSKHIKNAMIGGLISGLSSSAKGQDGLSLTAAGAVSTKSKGFKDVLGGGVLNGVSNAGDKVADYYLRQAEAMSPVLTIPAGVRVNAHITKGFFMGEIGTHRKIQEGRNKQLKEQVKSGESKEGGADERW